MPFLDRGLGLLLYVFLAVLLFQFLRRRGWFYERMLAEARRRNPRLNEARFRKAQLLGGTVVLAVIVLLDTGLVFEWVRRLKG